MLVSVRDLRHLEKKNTNTQALPEVDVETWWSGLTASTVTSTAVDVTLAYVSEAIGGAA